MIVIHEDRLAGIEFSLSWDDEPAMSPFEEQIIAQQLYAQMMGWA